MIKQLVSYFWQLSVLNEKPENSPYSPALMILSGVLLSIVMIMQWNFSDLDISGDIGIVLLTALSLTLSFIIYTYALLYFRGFKTRLVQTVTCLFFAHIIIHVLAFPLFALDPYLSHANLKKPLLLFIGVIYLFITLGLSIWQFVITAHIYKYALNTTAVQSVLAAFGLVAVNILTVSFWR